MTQVPEGTLDSERSDYKLDGQFSRTEMLIGGAALEKLKSAKVAVFGIGGVGGYVAEALARTGIGHLTIIDNDSVCLSNINRQIIAVHSTVGRDKTDVMAERIHDINPEAEVEKRKCFFLPENADTFDFADYSYVADAVDTVTAKIEIIMRARAAGIPVISSMGAGNKLDPGKLAVADIYSTQMCPLARVMRHELKKRGVDKLKVVYSREEPVKTSETLHGKVPGSAVFVPAAAGLMIASEIVHDILQDN